jgi:large subunit ribosomal protein L15
MPLSRRLPKRGFRNLFKKEVIAVNVESLNRFAENSIVDTELLLNSGLIKRTGDAIKILGNGDIKVPLTVKVDMISKGARIKIEAAGGSVVEVE